MIGRPGTTALPPFAWRPVAVVAAATVAGLLATAGGYGYHRDELYFRMLGFHPAWGYTDQPPLTPLLARAGIAVLGDSVRAAHTLPALLTGLTAVVLALLARELGGGRLAQILMATAAAGPLALAGGHALFTITLDVPACVAAEILIVRALRRNDARWWPWAGLVVGLTLYNKLLIILILAGLLVGLLAVGPRSVLRERRMWLGVAVAVVVGAPNLVYQVVEGFPQAEMASALADDRGDEARIAFIPMQLIAAGPLIAPVWLLGLARVLRSPRWRPLRCFAVAYLVICGFLLVQGGQFNYTFALQFVFLAVGFVHLEEWIRARRALGAPTRSVPMAAAFGLNLAVGFVIALPLIPVGSLGHTPIPAINQAARDTVGWPTYVDTIAAAYATLPADDQAHAVVVTGNYGEAGAVARYGPSRGLPAAYSGHTALAAYGPPPEDATAAVAVLQGDDALAWISPLFTTCRIAGTLDNGVNVENEEQGASVIVCTGRRRPWAQWWPEFTHLG